jgi:hypothetical protein
MFTIDQRELLHYKVLGPKVQCDAHEMVSAGNPGNVAPHQPFGAKTRGSPHGRRPVSVSCAHMASLSADVLVGTTCRASTNGHDDPGDAHACWGIRDRCQRSLGQLRASRLARLNLVARLGRVSGRRLRQDRKVPGPSREATMEPATEDIYCPSFDQSPGQHGRVCPRRSLRYRVPVHIQSLASVAEFGDAQFVSREASRRAEQGWRSRDGTWSPSTFLGVSGHKLCCCKAAGQWLFRHSRPCAKQAVVGRICEEENTAGTDFL